jgi:hypothetical protein
MEYSVCYTGLPVYAWMQTTKVYSLREFTLLVFRYKILENNEIVDVCIKTLTGIRFCSQENTARSSCRSPFGGVVRSKHWRRESLPLYLGVHVGAFTGQNFHSKYLGKVVPDLVVRRAEPVIPA